jgi:hypothetical protein
MSDLRYPIGPFQQSPAPSVADRWDQISQLAEMPSKLRQAVESLTSAQLDTPYRPNGWTVRQVVHHLTDTNLNWYIRIKFALTEDKPVIRPFDEKLWSDLQDARLGPIEPSLLLLEGLHARWVNLFESLESTQWTRELIHPERGVITLDSILPRLAWHGRHHTAHITELRRRMGW